MTKILVVDDSPTEVYQFKEMLEAHGFEVVTAENGRDGVAIAESEQPDCILMDIVMPDINGFQATRQICRNPLTEHIPVVIVSSKSQEADKVWGKRQGAQAYVTKPVDIDELVSVIKSVLVDSTA